MAQRVAYGAMAIAVLVLLFMQDVLIAKQSIGLAGPLGDLLRRGSLLPLLFIVVLLRGAVELDRLLRAKDINPHSVFAYLMIVVLLVTPWLSAAGWLGADVRDQEGLFWPLVALMVTVIGAGLLCVLRRHPRGAMLDMAATLLMVCPWALVPFAVIVITLPSLEIVRVPAMTSLPPFFWVNSTVKASTRFSERESASGLPVWGRSLPS